MYFLDNNIIVVENCNGLHMLEKYGHMLLITSWELKRIVDDRL